MNLKRKLLSIFSVRLRVKQYTWLKLRYCSANLSMPYKEDDIEELAIQAVTVRNFDGGFACSFTEDFDADKDTFWKCLLYEIRSSK